MIPNGLVVIWKSLPFLLVGMYPDGDLGGLALTVILSITIGVASFALGTILGSVAALLPPPFRWLPLATMVLVRGVPALAFLFWFYFLLPRLIGADLPPLLSAGIALTLYHGAYMGEDVRGGLRAVSTGQWEAARCLGLGYLPTLFLVVLPQALRAITPSLVGRFINLVIYTSVVSILGVLEFTRAAVLVNNRELLYPQYIFAFTGLVYFMLCYAVSAVGRQVERRWSWTASMTGRHPRSGRIPLPDKVDPIAGAFS
jgi:polar amino acid transport system permease protein